ARLQRQPRLQLRPARFVQRSRGPTRARAHAGLLRATPRLNAMRRLAAGLLGLGLCGAALAQYTGPLFDAHLHYNVEACADQRRPAQDCPHPLSDVLSRMQRNGVRGVLANSRPNEGTRVLASAREAAQAVGV